MKHRKINTTISESCLTNNNGCSFPTLSGSTTLNYHSTSTNFTNKPITCLVKEKVNLYSICVDWLEFICTWKEPIELTFRNNQNPRIVVEKINVHKNPNFRNLHRIYMDEVEVCDIYSTTNNGTHTYNEVSLKVNNMLLYTYNYHTILLHVLEVFSLTFNKLARIDIALDGKDIFKMIDYLNKYGKSATVQINNDAISILPTKFNKKKHYWLSWSIGKSNSGISARVYNKSEEIAVHKKEYVIDYWKKNNIELEKVGRFEIQLNYKQLKKYSFDITNLEQLQDAEFIGTIFKNEVQSWLKFYRVRKKDVDNHKKEVAINRGKEIQYIKWDKLPTNTELLQYVNYVSNSDYTNARNNISFNLHEVLRHPNTSTTTQVEMIEKYASDYNLGDYVKRKIITIFGNEIKYEYAQILKPLVNKYVNRER